MTTTDPDLEQLARAVLTERQLEVWLLAEKNLSQRAIAYHLRIDRATVRHHLEAANRRLAETAE